MTALMRVIIRRATEMILARRGISIKMKARKKHTEGHNVPDEYS